MKLQLVTFFSILLMPASILASETPQPRFQSENLAQQVREYRQNQQFREEMRVKGPGTSGGGDFIVADIIALSEIVLGEMQKKAGFESAAIQTAKLKFHEIRLRLSIEVFTGSFMIDERETHFFASSQTPLILINKKIWDQSNDAGKVQIITSLLRTLSRADLPEVQIEIH